MAGIREIAAGNKIENATSQLRAFELLGKYGFGEADSVWLESGEWMRIVGEITRRHLGDPAKFKAWNQEVKKALSSLK